MAVRALVLPIDAPPGLPWRQRQVALLEARHNSPAPPDKVAILLTRRAPWRVGRVGLFHAAVVRHEDMPQDSGIIVVETKDGPVAFSASPSASLRLLASGIVAASLIVIALVALVSAAVAAHSPPPPLHGSAIPPGKKRADNLRRNAAVIADLIAAKQAFGGSQGIQSIEWRPTGIVVEVARSDSTSATGDGRAFDKLPAVKGSNVDRWRLQSTARTEVDDAR